MNLKKEKEDKLNTYLQSIWDQKLESKNVNNAAIRNNLDWPRPELDYISEYAAKIGYLELGERGNVSLTNRGVQRIIQLNSPPEEPLIEPEIEIIKEVKEIESPKQRWYNKVFKKVFKR